MDAEAVTTVLTIVGTSFGAILAALITLMVASIRIQHRDSTTTRQLITDASKENRDLIDKNRDLIEKASKENRDLIEKASKENRDLIDRNHGTVIGILSDTRERLARIEGHLGIGWPAPDDPESDGDSREAA